MKIIFGTFAVLLLLSVLGTINGKYIEEIPINNITEPVVKELTWKETYYKWFPWKKPFRSAFQYRQDENGNECAIPPAHEGSSIDEFPDDIFTQEERQAGAVVLHFIGLVYFFSASGVVINYYFIPSIQCICNDLKITPDVGAAVFMATATATPEMFNNVISTFIAESDMGLGTIIGSLMWNILGVAAMSSLANTNPRRMDWVPITRDCIAFAFNASVLVIMAWDSRIYWYEALILLCMAVVYYSAMFQSARISKFMKRKFEDEYVCCHKEDFDLDDNVKKPSVYSLHMTASDPRASVYSMSAHVRDIETLHAKKRQSMTVHNHDFEILEAMKRRSTINKNMLDNGKKLSTANSDITEHIDEQTADASEKEREAYLELKKQRLGLWGPPKQDNLVRTIFWYYAWPIRVAIRCTMPNPKFNRRWYPFTFLVCVAWIGVVTYLLFWMLIIIGHTFEIPESVLGLTIFAIGGCTPELISGVIMARRGFTGTGIANSMGASSLGILLCLGVPWAISAILLHSEGKEAVMYLTSYGVRYVIMALCFVPLVQFTILSISKFKLLKVTGIFLMISYLSFVTYAVMGELDYLFPTPPECLPH